MYFPSELLCPMLARFPVGWGHFFFLIPNPSLLSSTWSWSFHSLEYLAKISSLFNNMRLTSLLSLPDAFCVIQVCRKGWDCMNGKTFSLLQNGQESNGLASAEEGFLKIQRPQHKPQTVLWRCMFKGPADVGKGCLSSGHFGHCSFSWRSGLLWAAVEDGLRTKNHHQSQCSQEVPVPPSSPCPRGHHLPSKEQRDLLWSLCLWFFVQSPAPGVCFRSS